MDGLGEQLFRAVEVNNPEEIERLITHGANVNAIKTSDGRGTPAIVAASYGEDVDCLEVLLDNGVNVDASDNDGLTALMKSSQLGHVY
jgi:ankyrin repeat protein